MKIGAKPRSQRTKKPRFPTRDHVIPKSVMPSMGTVVVCRQCNQDKGSRTLPEWHTVLKEAGDPRAAIVKRFMIENRARKFNRSTDQAEARP